MMSTPSSGGKCTASAALTAAGTRPKSTFPCASTWPAETRTANQFENVIEDRDNQPQFQ
jgi:hypothetical protein